MSRYIDADALYRMVKTETNPYGKPTLDYDSGNKVLDMINRMSTADVRPNEHGEWIVVYTTLANNQNGYITEFECDKCKEHQIITSNFCPNYGADMNGMYKNVQTHG